MSHIYLIERDAGSIEFSEARAVVVIVDGGGADARIVAEKAPGRQSKYVWHHPHEVTVTYLGDADSSFADSVILTDITDD
jgi:hypothetical protein